MDIEQEIKRTKKRAKWGCLIWAVILIIGPIILFVGYFYYHAELKERTLTESVSPNGAHTIEIVEKGEPAFFGPSSVRIKYGKEHIDRIISNDGKMLHDSNVSVEWKSDDTAIITLFGEEQVPETIEFKKEDPNLFKNVQTELDSITLTTSESPDSTKIIEIREILRSQGEKPRRFLRIYYGENESILENYEEFDHLNRVFRDDQFNIEWTSDTQATIRIISGNEFMDSIQIEFDK